MKKIMTLKRLPLILVVALLASGALMAQPANRPGPQRGESGQQRAINPDQARAMMLSRLAQMDDEQLENLHKAIEDIRKMSPEERQAFAERTRARMAEGRGTETPPSRKGVADRELPPALRDMPEEKRQQLRERIRQMTPEEREEFRRELQTKAQERRSESSKGEARE